MRGGVDVSAGQGLVRGPTAAPDDRSGPSVPAPHFSAPRPPGHPPFPDNAGQQTQPPGHTADFGGYHEELPPVRERPDVSTPARTRPPHYLKPELRRTLLRNASSRSPRSGEGATVQRRLLHTRPARPDHRLRTGRRLRTPRHGAVARLRPDLCRVDPGHDRRSRHLTGDQPPVAHHGTRRDPGTHEDAGRTTSGDLVSGPPRPGHGPAKRRNRRPARRPESARYGLRTERKHRPTHPAAGRTAFRRTYQTLKRSVYYRASHLRRRRFLDGHPRTGAPSQHIPTRNRLHGQYW